MSAFSKRLLQSLTHYRYAIGLFFFPWGAYFCVQWSRMLSLREGALVAGHPWVWADWGLHVALSSVFAYKPISLWFDTYPLFSGATLTYPFMTNLLSGLLMRLGFSIPEAFIVPSLILTALILIGLYRWYQQFFRSQVWAAVAGTIFLCSGGLGFFYHLASEGVATALTDTTLIHAAISEVGIEVNNITASMIFPQRAYLLGLPMGLFILHTLYSHFVREQRAGSVSPVRLVLAGFLAGLLLVCHTHTFIFIVLLSLWLFLFSWRQLRTWLWYGIPAVIVSTTLYLSFFYGNLSAGSFFTWQPGWYIQTGIREWILFWLRNWGAFFLLAIYGTLQLIAQREQKILRIVSFFWFLFVLANLVKFQPQTWDNTKLFSWVYLGLVIPYITGLKAFLGSSPLRSLRGLIVMLCLAVTILSGGIDIVHNLDTDRKTFQMLSADQVELGEYVRDHTAPDAVILTTDSVQNPVAMISGRSVLLGYAGWMLNFGLPYQQRQLDIPTMYRRPEQSTALFDRYSIDYVLVSRDEEQYDPSEFSTGFSQVFSNTYGVLYKRL